MASSTAAPPAGDTLAFVESPVQLLNVLEWAHRAAPGTGPAGTPVPPGTPGAAPPAAPDPAEEPGEGALAGGALGGARTTAGGPTGVTVVVLAPHDPMTRGQLRRMAQLARDEGHRVEWAQAREGALAPLKTLAALARPLRRARRLVIGDPFSRYVQLLLALAGSEAELTVVDDGTATMEFVGQLARGERFVRWHRKGAGGLRALLFAPVSGAARRRLTPRGERAVEVFSAMPVDPPERVRVAANDFAWTRARFGPPRLTQGTDLVGTSLVETGVVDPDRYLEAVVALTRTHGATRYFAHRRESPAKLHRIAAEAGLEIVRPDLPLELVARRGPIGRTILSFPSTVVHTLPLALTGTGVRVAVCEVDPAWLTAKASPRAGGFLAAVSGTARDAQRLRSSGPPPAATA